MKSRCYSCLFSFGLVGLVLLVCEIGLAFRLVYHHTGEPSLLWLHAKRKTIGVIQRLCPTGLYEDDPRLGYRHRSSIVADHFSLDFSVQYTTDTGGNRLIPPPTESLGRVAFAGGSYTFGHAVENAENFPAILASEIWPDWTVENWGVSGYGTAHVYLKVKDAIEQDTPPDAIVYGLLNSHRMRTYVNEEWIKALRPFGRRHPHFEIEDDALVFKGLVGLEGAMPDNEVTQARELALMIRMIQEMDRLCRERGVAFFVILFPGEKWPPRLVASLYRLEHEPIDLSGYRLRAFRYDGHPNPADHRYFADAIGRSSLNEWVHSRR